MKPYVYVEAGDPFSLADELNNFFLRGYVMQGSVIISHPINCGGEQEWYGAMMFNPKLVGGDDNE